MTQALSEPQFPSQAKVEELESIRGIAALLVVAFHMPPWNDMLNIGIIHNGYLMVDLFFVLSGFVICRTYEHKIKTTAKLIQFQFLRFGRLYPIHFLFLIASVGIELTRYFSAVFLHTTLTEAPFEKNTLTALIQQLFLVQAIGPMGHPDSFNGPAWSISVEFYTYLIFGLLVLWSGKLRCVAFFLLFIGSLLLLDSPAPGYANLLRCTTGFFLGCLTSELDQHLTIRVTPLLSLATLVGIVLYLVFKHSFECDWLIYFLTAVLILSLTKSVNGAVRRVLKSRLLVWLGTLSYSIYMAHYMVIRIFDASLRRFFHIPARVIDDVVGADLTAVQTIAASIALFVIVIFLSYLANRLVESPLRTKSREIAFTRLG